MSYEIRLPKFYNKYVVDGAIDPVEGSGLNLQFENNVIAHITFGPRTHGLTLKIDNYRELCFHNDDACRFIMEREYGKELRAGKENLTEPRLIEFLEILRKFKL